jgi:hypothetical protein
MPDSLSVALHPSCTCMTYNPMACYVTGAENAQFMWQQQSQLLQMKLSVTHLQHAPYFPDRLVIIVTMIIIIIILYSEGYMYI